MRAVMTELLNAITHIGWIAVLIVIFAESGLMVGFFLPGDSLLFIAGTLVQQGIFHINIVVFVVCLFVAAVAGNSTGYFLGKKFGRKLFNRPNSRFFRQEYLLEAEKFYEKNGSKAIVIAMFIPIVRAFAPVVAGIAHMPFRKFAFFNIVGAAIWVSSFTLLGYFAGDVIERTGINIEAAALIVIFLSLLPGIVHLLKQPENRAKLKHHARKIVRRQ
jgi:membrane-associated protein